MHFVLAGFFTRIYFTPRRRLPGEVDRSNAVHFKLILWQQPGVVVDKSPSILKLPVEIWVFAVKIKGTATNFCSKLVLLVRSKIVFSKGCSEHIFIHLECLLVIFSLVPAQCSAQRKANCIITAGVRWKGFCGARLFSKLAQACRTYREYWKYVAGRTSSCSWIPPVLLVQRIADGACSLCRYAPAEPASPPECYNHQKLVFIEKKSCRLAQQNNELFVPL